MPLDTLKRIWIVCYTFPPSPGIGGRRWIKHAKYLARQGHDITVVAAKASDQSSSSPWDDDLKYIKRVIYLPRCYPKQMTVAPHSLLDRILYRAYETIFSILKDGSIYDRALFWRRALYKVLIPKLESHEVDVICATGAPFRLLSYIADLKKKYTDFCFIADFRDPWITSHTYGMEKLSELRKRYESNLEENVVRCADKIIAPVEPMIDQLKNRYPNCSNKMFHLPHGYDPEEIPIKSRRRSASGCRWIFYGTLYDGLDIQFMNLAELLAMAEGDLTIDIYSSDEQYKNMFTDKNVDRYVRYFKPISAYELFDQFENYDAVLMIYPDRFSNHLSTKFFETFYAQIPIVLISKAGQASEFINRHRLGTHFTTEQICTNLFQYLKGKKSSECEGTIDLKPYAFENIVSRLEQLF